jgi:alpha-glucosidase
MPYLYSAFVAAGETGDPIQRPLVFDYQYDPNTHNLDSQYLLGDSLLVAPIFEADATARGVYLPAGGWYNWHTGEVVVSAGQTVRVEAQLDTIPLFAKAGSVIAMWPEAPKSTADYYPEEIVLKVFVPLTDGTSSSVFQEDDGLTYAANVGSRLRTTISVTRNGKVLAVSASTDGHGFAEFARKRFRLELIGAEVAEDNQVVLENSGNDFEVSFRIL